MQFQVYAVSGIMVVVAFAHEIVPSILATLTK